MYASTAGRRPAFPVSLHARLLASCAFVLAIAGRCLAQDSTAGTALEPVVVTAARVAQPLSATLPSTSVITRADIEDSQEEDVLTLLRRLAGVEFAQAGGLGSQSSVFMRGANSNQTLVLVDGVPINPVESGGALLQHLMLAQVDHIEVVRGNVSALYGSQAVGGVIQIFTRAAGLGSAAAIDVQGGNERTGNAAFGAATTTGSDGAHTHLAASGSVTTAGGFSAINPAFSSQVNPSADTYRNGSMSMVLSQEIGTSLVRLRVLDSYARLEFDDPTDYSFLVPGYDGRLQTNLESTHLSSAILDGTVHLSSAWSMQLRASSQTDRTVDTSSFAPSFLVGTTLSRTRQLGWDNTFILEPGQSVTASLEHRDEVGNSTAYAQEFTRRVDSAFAGYLGSFGAHEVQLNVRTDRYSDFGSAESELLAYGYHFLPHFRASAQLSTAFDAPTFDDLYFPGASNPALKPEKSRSVEGGVDYANGGVTARVSVYRTEVRDLIEFDPTTFVPLNVAHARLTGAEFSTSVAWGDWRSYANLTVQRPLDSDTDQLLLRRATHNVNLGLSRRVGPWYFGLDVSGSGARYDDDINTFARISLPGYTVTNVVGRYALDARTTLSLSLHNAFDRRYMLVDGYNTAGRVLLAGLSVRL